MRGVRWWPVDRRGYNQSVKKLLLIPVRLIHILTVPGNTQPAPTPTTPRRIVQPGIYPDLSSLEYHTGPGVSKSGLDALRRSPAHYWHEYGIRSQVGEDDWTPDDDEDPETEKRALLFGRAFHALILERATFRERFAVRPLFGRKAAERQAKDEWMAAHAGKGILTNAEGTIMKAMRESLTRHPVASKLLDASTGVAEHSIYWTDPETGVLCKCRPDWWRRDNIVVDLKSALDASPDTFTRTIAQRRYHVQHAFYSDGIRAAGHEVKGFVFVSVEKEAPFEVGVYNLDGESVELGRTEYREDLQRYRLCAESNQWPGYCEKITKIGLPAWRLPKQ